MKKLLLVVFFAIALIVFPREVLAEDQFRTNVIVNYDIEKDGSTKITHKISIENLISNLYAKSYSLFLEGIDPVSPQAYEADRKLPTRVEEVDGKTVITVDFPEPVVGKGAKRDFTVIFDDASVAVKTGEVWEVSIPKITNAESFGTYQVILSVPSEFGNLAYISPEPSGKETGKIRSIYVFGKDLVEKSGVVAAFGQFQVFDFKLIYHIENPLAKFATTEVAIPPDTAFQKINYQSMNPTPHQVRVDSDGNFLAVYNLKPRERFDIEVKGVVQIFTEPRDFITPSAETLNANKKGSEVWQVNDPLIVETARNLITPRAIYEYIVRNFAYDYERVKPNVERFGAVRALQNPKNAICMEFTDAFIALSRSAGTPAREVNGFAYTENPELQPLSLVADVLHSWPEYWDYGRQTWIPVDPTWGSTTGGVDYFSKLDLRHFTFVIHGMDPYQPYPPGSYKLGPNPQKDVFVTFGQLPAERSPKPQIVVNTQRIFPFTDMKLSVKVKNNGTTSLFKDKATILFDSKEVITAPIDLLPPYGYIEIPVTVPFSFFGQNTPEQITILVADEALSVPTYKVSVIIANLIAVLAIVFVLALGSYLKIKRINLIKYVNDKVSKIRKRRD